MKIKNFIILALLFAISFSIVHEYVFSFYDSDHCSVTEYVSEIDAPSHHGDICDIHFEYHIAYILPSQTVCPLTSLQRKSFSTLKESYLSFDTLQLNKPPIA